MTAHLPSVVKRAPDVIPHDSRRASNSCPGRISFSRVSSLQRGHHSGQRIYVRLHLDGLVRCQGAARRPRLNSLELIFRPAPFAASSLIWKRILLSSLTKLIMPPVSTKRSVSPTVRILTPRRPPKISDNRFFSHVLT